MNFFLFGRRLTLLLIWATGIIGVIIAYNKFDYVGNVRFAIDGHVNFIPGDQECFDNEHEHSGPYLYSRKTMKTEDGIKVRVRFCHVMFTGNDNGKYIPTLVTSTGTIFGYAPDEKISQSEMTIKEEKAKIKRGAFTLEDRALQWWNYTQGDDFWQIASWTWGIGWFWFVASMIIGWLLRGLFGLKDGQDRKAKVI